jgi:ornithine cyclodeaminase
MRTMAMLGAGAMAFDQVMAVKEVRPILEVLVWSRDPAHAAALAARVDGEVAPDPSNAVEAADVVTTATPSREPLFDPAAVQPGTHVNAIGAFTPEMCEIPPEVVRSARVFIDDVEAAAAEAGDILQAGVRPEGTIADLLAGRVRQRAHDDITLFKSVGIASQDVAAAGAALAEAAKLGIGTQIE